MNKFVRAAALACVAFAATTTAASAQTIKVMIAQEDWDKDTIKRSSRIQKAVLNTFNQTLHAPDFEAHLSRYGIKGLDVFDETIKTLDFYYPNGKRRPDAEIITIAREIQNPKLDVLVLYSLYARAVKSYHAPITKLQMSLSYRAIDLRDGKFLGGDNLDLDTSGIPFRGCAAGPKPDAHCVKEFVSQYGEQLARDAGNQLALQLAALLGPVYGTAAAGPDVPPPPPAAHHAPDKGVPAPAYVTRPYRNPACANIPTHFAIKFIGFSNRRINFIEENMSHWKCVLEVDVDSSNLSQVVFAYKTRADQQRVLRNIRIMTELMGVIAEARTQGPNEIIVKRIPIRTPPH